MMVFLGAALTVRWSTLISKSALLGVLAGPPRAAEEAELWCGAPGAPYGSINGLRLLVHIVMT